MLAMFFAPNNFYHIYNRGNNKQPIFFNRGNYLYFLKKVRKELSCHFDFLAYCLMPNHFHFLTMTKQSVDNEKSIRGLANMLSSYTQAINNQEKTTGTLFQRRTKAKTINQETNHLYYCLKYIHQNPFRAGLVTKLEDWEFSSFRDYVGIRNGTLCNIAYFRNLLGSCRIEDFYEASYQDIERKYIESFEDA